jgi:hypothetical protein
MGSVAAECSHGCSCRRKVWNGHAAGTTSTAQVSYGLPVSRTGGAPPSTACPCTIRLSVLNATESGGHKFKLVGVLSGFPAGGTINDAVRL